MTSFLDYFLGPGTTFTDLALAGVDVGVVAYLIYRVLVLIRGTRALNMLAGIFMVGVGYLFAQWANLVTLHWVLGHFLTYSVLGVIILFQDDIRRGLAQLGRGKLLASFAADQRVLQAGVIEAVTRAAVDLSRRRAGALVAIERLGDLGEVAETGVRLDAAVSPEVLLSIFHPGSPLHDGAAVLQRGRVSAASCLLPLTPRPTARDLGTRHRAALGLAEQVDAAVVVVSEERGEISVAVDGAMQRGLDEGKLRHLLAQLLVPVPPRGMKAVLARLARRRRARRPPAPPPPEDHRAAI